MDAPPDREPVAPVVDGKHRSDLREKLMADKGVRHASAHGDAAMSSVLLHVVRESERGQNVDGHKVERRAGVDDERHPQARLHPPSDLQRDHKAVVCPMQQTLRQDGVGFGRVAAIDVDLAKGTPR